MVVMPLCYIQSSKNVNRMSIDENLTIKAHDLIKNNIDQNHLLFMLLYINLANPSNQSFTINFLKQEIKDVNN